MRAAILRELGSTPDVGDFDEPSGNEWGTIVDVTAAGLNPVDLFIATGKMPRAKPEPPSVVGLEGIGTVSGEDRRVYFNGSIPPFGSFAERTVAETGELIDVPDGIADAQALCFGVAGMAGWISLEWRAELKEGETVLVLGASGVVGRIATQAARLQGAGRVVAAARSEDELADLGADATVRIEEDGFAEALGEAAPAGIDVIIDPLWGPPAMAALGTLNEYGRLIQIGNSASPTAELSASAFRNKHASIVGYSNFAVPFEVRAEAFQKMCAHAAKGELRADTEEVGLDEVADAWSRQSDGPHHKIVIRP